LAEQQIGSISGGGSGAIAGVANSNAAGRRRNSGATATSSGPLVTPQSVHLSEESARKLAASRPSAVLLGDVVSLLARSPKYKSHTLADLEWLVAPALMTGQFQMAEGMDPATGARGSLALVIWANVSDEVEGRLRSNAGQSHRLRPEEWAGGPHAWLMLAAGEPRALQGLLGNIAGTHFKERPLLVEQRDASGRTVVTSLGELLRANVVTQKGAGKPS
jgi:hemolysin-activating ACP:hemolysin acyltransferase